MPARPPPARTPLLGLLALAAACQSAAEMVDASSPDAGLAQAPDAATSAPAAVVRWVAGQPGAGRLEPWGTLPHFEGITAVTACPGDEARVYVADTFGVAIYAVALDGAVRLIAGAPGRPGLADGAGERARFQSPRGLACLADGAALVVADSGAFRKVALPSGEVETVAGFPGTPGNVDGDATTARIGYLIHAMAVAPDGASLIFTDRSNRALRSLDVATWAVRTVSPPSAGWNGPGGLAFDAHDPRRVWVADTFNGRLRALDVESGEITERPLAGGARLPTPQGLAIVGRHAFAMGFDPVIRRVDLDTGVVDLVRAPFAGAFASPVALGPRLVGAPLEPEAVVAWDLDLEANTGAEVVLAGRGLVTSRDGDLDTARFGPGAALAGTPGAEVVFSSDPEHGTLRRLAFEAPGAALTTAPRGSLETVAPEGLPRLDGVGAPARFVRPGSLALADGVLYVADEGAGVIWSVPLDDDLLPTGISALASGLREPAALVVGPWLGDDDRAAEAASHLYIAEAGAHRVLALDLARAGEAPKVLAGSGRAGAADGPALEAQLREPRALLLDAARGALLVADAGGRSLRRYTRDDDGARVETWLAAPAEEATLPSDGAAPVLGGAAALFHPAPGVWLALDASAMRRLHLDAEGRLAEVKTIAGQLLRPGGVPRGASPEVNAPIFGRPSAALPVWHDGQLRGVLVATDDALVAIAFTGENPWW